MARNVPGGHWFRPAGASAMSRVAARPGKRVEAHGSKKNLHRPGNPSPGRSLRSVTAETPPPVQAAGDTIPKGLRSGERRPFFFIPPARTGRANSIRKSRCATGRTARAWRRSPAPRRAAPGRKASRTPAPSRRCRAGCPRASRSRTRSAGASGPSMSTSSASAQPSSRSARWTSSTIASAGPCFERFHGAGDARAQHHLGRRRHRAARPRAPCPGSDRPRPRARARACWRLPVPSLVDFLRLMSVPGGPAFRPRFPTARSDSTVPRLVAASGSTGPWNRCGIRG